MFLSSPRKTRKTVSNTVGSEPWEVVYCMEKTAPTPLSATQTSPQIGGRDLEGEIAEAVHG